MSAHKTKKCSYYFAKAIQNPIVFSYNGGKYVEGTTVQRDKLRKIILMIFGFPIALLMLGNCIASYIPPTESYKKAPFQLEELFNEQMAQYGMSMDVDSVNYGYGDHITKTVPIQCEDGSVITCTMYTTSDRKKALIEYMVFTQELTGREGETIYIEPILKFMLDTFYTNLTKDKDDPIDEYLGVSYNEAIRLCDEFINGTEENTHFHVMARTDLGNSINLERTDDEKPSISISLVLATN